MHRSGGARIADTISFRVGAGGSTSSLVGGSVSRRAGAGLSRTGGGYRPHMAEITREPQHGHSHPPAHEAEGAEPPEETVARAVDESRQAHLERNQMSEIGVDPTTRRGFNSALGRRAALGFLVGAVIGAGIGALLRVAPAPLGNVGELPGTILVMAFFIGVIVAVIVAFITLEREDGRIERQVEEDLGRQPAPGRPLDPKHDV